jgi:transcriptional regulator with XRE-family HTH domain
VTGPDSKQIGAWLKKARQRARVRARKVGVRDFSVEKAARRVAVGEKTVRLWENGTNPPPTDKFLALVLAYDADLTTLLPKKPPRTVEVEGGIDVPHSSTRSVEAEGKKKRPA